MNLALISSDATHIKVFQGRNCIFEANSANRSLNAEEIEGIRKDPHGFAADCPAPAEKELA